MTRPIYLDHNSTTPVDPRVLERMLPYFTESFGNASSVDHLHGVIAHKAVEEARGLVAAAIGAHPSEIIFTSGATESNNLAIIGAAQANSAKGRHLITTAIEHPAVLETFEHLSHRGFEVTILPVESDGRVNLSDLESALRADTTLVSVMAANNEVGTIQPLQAIGAMLAGRGIIFHTDAAQALATVDLNVDRDGVHLMSLSSHKAYGPKGVGALYVRHRKGRISLSPQTFGGGHERGLRSGTLNVPGIVGFGAAAGFCKAARTKEAKRLEKMRDAFLEQLTAKVSDITINGSLHHRLPGNLNLHFPGIENRALIHLVAPMISISAGSACTTTEVTPSHVLLAIGRSETHSHESIRVSIGRLTSEEDISIAAETIAKAVAQLQRAALPRRAAP